MSNQQAVKESLDDLFDIAHRDALTLIKIEEESIYLQAQREKGRRGTMGSVDRTLALQEKLAAKRKAAADVQAVCTGMERLWILSLVQEETEWIDSQY